MYVYQSLLFTHNTLKCFFKCSHPDSTSPSESTEYKPFQGSDGNGES